MALTLSKDIPINNVFLIQSIFNPIVNYLFKQNRTYLWQKSNITCTFIAGGGNKEVNHSVMLFITSNCDFLRLCAFNFQLEWSQI